MALQDRGSEPTQSWGEKRKVQKLEFLHIANDSIDQAQVMKPHKNPGQQVQWCFEVGEYGTCQRGDIS